MTRYTREITEEIYNNAMNNHGYIASADEKKVFTMAEMCGYGIYSPKVAKTENGYVVNFYMGDSCD